MKRRVRTLGRIVSEAWEFHRELARRGGRVAKALGTGPLNGVWLRFLPLVLFWRRRFTGPASRGLRVRFQFRSRKLQARFSELCDFEILEEVFVDEAYGTDLPESAGVVVDLGSHVGISALYFAVRYPGARVLAVEPNPALQPRLKANTAQFQSIETVDVALAATSGTAHLKVVGDSWAGTLDESGGETVRTTTFAELLSAHDLDVVDVLKIDIEGAEFDVLTPANLKGVGTIVGELHPESSEQLGELAALLEPLFDLKIEPGGEPWWTINARSKSRRAEAAVPGRD